MLINLLVYSLLSLAIFSLVTAPWITSVIYFLNGVMKPKYLWPWTFPDLTLSKYLAMASILAWGFALLRKKIDFSIYAQKQNFLLLLMWVLIHLSNIFSDFPEYTSGASTEIVLDTYNTIFILYFVSLGILSDYEKSQNALLWLAMVFVVVGSYYSYWANDLYIQGRWDMFYQGRLIGPRGSAYGDENLLATLVVMCMPFILLGFFYAKNFWLKWSCIGMIPFLWHAIFLFGSRGSLLSLAITTLLLSTILRKHRMVEGALQKVKGVSLYKGLIVVGLIAAVVYQGGVLLSRTAGTVESAKSDDTDEPLNPRLVSWSVGIDLIKEYPLLGVGTQRFLLASHLLYPERSVHVAHNTFLNFSANTGLPVGICFLTILFMSHRRYRESVRLNFGDSQVYEYVSKATYCSLFGFTICSIFLDLIVFEAFYLAILMSFLTHYMMKKKIALDEAEQAQASQDDTNLMVKK